MGKAHRFIALEHRAAASLALTLGWAFAAPPVQAADYPNRPLRIIVPFSPGGATDVLARLIGKHLTDAWGQQAVVDNRTGANGVIAAELVAKSNPDGHSLLMVAIGHTTNPSLQKKLPYDTERDFQAISLTAIFPLVLGVHPTVKAANLQEFIALARSSAKPLNYGSGGVGSSQHLASELLNSMAKIQMTHVPYKGGAPALLDLLGGQVNLMITTTSAVLPHSRTGKLRALGITTAKRSSVAPEVPTFAESGLPGYESIAWYGLVAPAGLPPAVLNKLANEVVKGTRAKEMHDALVKQGAEPVGNGPKEFTAFIKSEITKYARVIREAGIKPE